MAPVPAAIVSDGGLAIMAASILLACNDPGRARVLLDRAERTLRTAPRLGAGGYGLAGAEIHALRGDKAAAVRAIREAVKAGWRGPFWRGALLFGRDFVPLHGDPGYQAAVAEIRRDMAKQRAELAATSASRTAARP